MFPGFILLAAFAAGLAADHSSPRIAPSYNGGSVVNAADNQPNSFAPNSIATMYGVSLAYTTRALLQSDMHGGVIPSTLSGTGVHVLVGNIPAGIYYVSPGQINFLIPGILIPGPSTILLAIDGLHGPAIQIQITSSAPAFFQLDARTPIATRPDGSVITPDNPVHPGDYVVLYANGLGAVVPPLNDREVPMKALLIQESASLGVLLDGVALDPTLILYAGVSPGFAGLYQVNLKLPATLSANPEIRITLGDQISPPGLLLPVAP